MDGRLRRNVCFALLGQGAALAAGGVGSLVLPKALGAEAFSYWQLFLFHASYLPCLALGLNDGVYLRYGGCERARLDLAALKSQLVAGLLAQGCAAAAAGGCALALLRDPWRKGMAAAALVYYLLYTCHNFLGYLFQACGEAEVWAKSLLLDRGLYLAALGALLALGRAGLWQLLGCYLAAQGCAALYLIGWMGSAFVRAKCSLAVGRAEWRRSVRAGWSLMLANLCSMLVLGAGRQVADLRWGVQAFGQLSFALSLVNAGLAFLAQVGLVLFPALRRMEAEGCAAAFRRMQKRLFLLLPAVYILYFPCAFFLKRWLPDYAASLACLPALMPICYFDCQMHLVGATFLKVLGRQDQLLRINLTAVGVCTLCSLAAAWGLDSVYGVACGMSLASACRCLLAQRALRKTLGGPARGLWDAGLAAVFVALAGRAPWQLTAPVLAACLAARWVWAVEKAPPEWYTGKKEADG